MRIGKFVIFEKVGNIEALKDAVDDAEKTLLKYRQVANIMFDSRFKNIETQLQDIKKIILNMSNTDRSSYQLLESLKDIEHRVDIIEDRMKFN